MTDWEKKHIENVTMLRSSRLIKAKDISIFVEDGKPYIHWVGEYNDGKDKYEVDIPKLGTDIYAIIEDKPIEYDLNGLYSYPRISFRQDVYVLHDDIDFAVKCKKKKMTKEQIEKELGYKIEIEDEDDD